MSNHSGNKSFLIYSSTPTFCIKLTIHVSFLVFLSSLKLHLILRYEVIKITKVRAEKHHTETY